MKPYDLLYLSLFSVLPVALAFLPRERRFLVLLTCILLVPREFNVRFGPLSFCLTDAAFLGFLAPEALKLFREGWRTNPLFRGSASLWAALACLSAATLHHGVVSGVPNLRFFLKDLLPLVFFILLFMALRASGLTWNPTFLRAMAHCLLLSSFAVVLLTSVPDWTRTVHETLQEGNRIGMELGYFLPSGLQKAVPEGQTLDPAKLRLWGIVSGVPLGMTLLFFLPAALGTRKLLARDPVLFLALLGVLLYAALFMRSRSMFGALFMVLLCGLALFERMDRRACAATLGLLAALAWLTPIGQVNLGRYAYLKKPELEGLNPKKVLPPAEGGRRIYDSRFPIWKAALEKVRERPLLGLGPGSTLVFPYGHRQGESVFVDSLYVMLLLKWGAAGFLFFLLWTFQWVRDWWRAWPALRKDPGFEAGVLRGFPPTLAAFLFLGTFVYPLMNVSFSLLLGLYLGLTLNTLEAWRDKSLDGGPGA